LWHPKRVALRKEQNETKRHALTECRRQISEGAVQIRFLPKAWQRLRRWPGPISGDAGQIQRAGRSPQPPTGPACGKNA
jgi:hypothetical protein